MVLTGYYRPDGGPAAPLFTMLCEALVKRGHQVTALTAVPHYPTGMVAAEYRGKYPRVVEENGVKVIRVSLPSIDRTNLGARLMQFAAFQINSFIAGLHLEFDVFIAHSPALEVWLPFIWQSKLRKKPGIYSVHDVYPDVGVQSGIFKSQAVVQGVTIFEKACLKNATKIRVLSKSFINELSKMGVEKTKIELIYDWIDVDNFKPERKDNPFARANGLLGKFIVMFAGNLGLVQGLISVVDSAKLLSSNEDIEIIFVGDGAGKNVLVERTQELNLGNVRFLPYQQREVMPEVLASADVSLVTLKKGAAFGALPSKIYSILSSGRPIIASLDPGSDAWEIVERSKGGICVPPESPEELANAILTMKNNDGLLQDCSHNGREYVRKYHTPEYAAERFEKLLYKAIEDVDGR